VKPGDGALYLGAMLPRQRDVTIVGKPEDVPGWERFHGYPGWTIVRFSDGKEHAASTHLLHIIPDQRRAEIQGTAPDGWL
jgi:hypothetical protein